MEISKEMNWFKGWFIFLDWFDRLGEKYTKRAEKYYSGG